MPVRSRLVVPALAVLLGGAVVPARDAAPAASPSAVEYVLDFTGAARRELAVEATFRGLEGPQVVRMSRTSPGRYAIHDFGKNVYAVSAIDGAGAPIGVLPETPHRWRVDAPDGTLRFRYRVFGDRIDGTYLGVDATHGHVNMPAALVWIRELEDRPVRVRIVPPPGADWQVATQLFPTADRLVFTAPNLAYLMDSPIEASAFTRRSFTPAVPAGAEGTPPAIVLAMHHEGTEREADAFASDLEALVPEAAAVFGEYPAFETGTYTFLADYLPWAVADGMEHRNSTVLTSSTPVAAARSRLMETAAHEVFHAWNVERIRPRSLEPFDFEEPMASPDLWLAEGVTSYYAALLMVRAGLTSFPEFVQSLEQDLGVVLTSAAPRIRSAEDMSRMAILVDGGRPPDATNWAHTYVSYYTHGAVIGLGLDLTIRARTGNRQSLDDLMRTLWVRHGAVAAGQPGAVARPYTIDDVRTCLADVLDDPEAAGTLLRRYVQGREVMDYGPLLAQAGLLLGSREPGRASLGPLALDSRGDRLRVSAATAPGSPAWEAGLSEGDEVLAVGGRPVRTVGDVERALAGARPGDRVTLRFIHRGEARPREYSVHLVQDAAIRLTTSEAATGRLDALAQAFRAGWIGARAARPALPAAAMGLLGPRGRGGRWQPARPIRDWRTLP